jgi:hypothetical protein
MRVLIVEDERRLAGNSSDPRASRPASSKGKRRRSINSSRIRLARLSFSSFRVGARVSGIGQLAGAMGDDQ